MTVGVRLAHTPTMNYASNSEMIDELQRECINQVRFYVDLAANKLGVHIPMPKIIFNNMGRTAGRAHIGRNLIEFNPVLLRTNGEEFLERAPGHEVAHLIAHVKFNRPSPHGCEWRLVMNRFGLPAIRCHNYDVPAITGGPQKKVVAVVRHEDMTIKQVRGAKIIQFD